jgi:serine/threonine protein kinase
MLTVAHFQEFTSEAVTWRQLSHPNVLPFYGVYQLARNPPRVCLACPWMENGNLVQFLANRALDTNCIPLVCYELKVSHDIHHK